MRRALLLSLFLFLSAQGVPFLAHASSTNGSIIGSPAYAWGEDMGWVNFAPDSGGLTITDTTVTGYAWSSVAGWINFNPTASGQGVINTPDGHLSGFAWVAGLGWLDMSHVSITSSGKFTGVAGVEGAATGRVSFDCDRCNVETDWRPASARASTPAPANSGNGGPIVNTPLQTSLTSTTSPEVSPAALLSTIHISPLPVSSNAVHAFNTPLAVTPLQSGELVHAFGPNAVIVDVPVGASKSTLTITVVQNPQPADALGGALFIGGVVFDVTAQDASGAFVHHFDVPLKITLSIPEPLQDKDTGVYWFNESTTTWVRVPDVTFTASTASFYVDHLTRFAILHAPGLPGEIHISAPYGRMPDMKKILAAAVIIIALGAYIWWSHRSDSSVVVVPTTVASTTPVEDTPVNTNPSGTVSTTGAGQYKDGTYTGSVADSVYGPVQIKATVSGGKLTDVTFLDYPKTPQHSLDVSNTVMPQLKTEAIAMQSANVNTISGATQTVEAFQQSLASALTQAQS